MCPCTVTVAIATNKSSPNTGTHGTNSNKHSSEDRNTYACTEDKELSRHYSANAGTVAQETIAST